MEYRIKTWGELIDAGSNVLQKDSKEKREEVEKEILPPNGFEHSFYSYMGDLCDSLISFYCNPNNQNDKILLFIHDRNNISRRVTIEKWMVDEVVPPVSKQPPPENKEPLNFMEKSELNELAARAMQGMLAGGYDIHEKESLVSTAYEIAREMMETDKEVF